MTDHPELDKAQAARPLTEAAGDFLEWLQSQGLNLMRFREDLTDTRLTDAECKEKLDSDAPLPACYQTGSTHRPADPPWGEPSAWWRRHCLHFADPARPATAPAEQGHCCRCGKGRHYEVTGIRGWSADGRSIVQLLADWQGIDLAQVDREQRAILAELRAAQEQRP